MLAPTTVTPAQLAAASAAETSRVNRAVEARVAREAAAAAEREAAQAAVGAAELSDYREHARAAWLGSGGSAAEFNDSWPELKRRHLSELAVSKLSAHDRLIEQTKAEMRASGRYSRM